MKVTKDQKVASTTNGGKKETVKLATSTNMRVTNKTKTKTKLSPCCVVACLGVELFMHKIVKKKKSDIQATGHNMYRNTL